ncbi:MAG: hypothetical protein ACK2T0_14965, partial [Anaerolineales bacterium]
MARITEDAGDSPEARLDDIAIGTESGQVESVHKLAQDLELPAEFRASAGGIAGDVAADPQAQEGPRCRSEGVALDAERADRLGIAPGDHPHPIQAVPLQRLQVTPAIEIEVQYRPVVLGAGDQRDRPAAPLEVVRILRMEPGSAG